MVNQSPHLHACSRASSSAVTTDSLRTARAASSNSSRAPNCCHLPDCLDLVLAGVLTPAAGSCCSRLCGLLRLPAGCSRLRGLCTTGPTRGLLRLLVGSGGLLLRCSALCACTCACALPRRPSQRSAPLGWLLTCCRWPAMRSRKDSAEVTPPPARGHPHVMGDGEGNAGFCARGKRKP